MALKDDNTLITKGDLKKFYNKILPYMGGNYIFNTLGTNNYYSTDEKIVGVWTDGKPLYRKFIIGTFPSNENENILSTIPSDIDKIWVNGGISFVWSDTYGMRPVSFYYNSGSYFDCWIDCTRGVIFIQKGNAYLFAGDNIYVALEYTKTTDAANSAVNTIGCYDITRPDLWPENKEITFGNGLYGQRFTGTYSLSAKQWKSINLSTLVPSSIIDYGGTIQQFTWFNTLPLCYIGNDGALQSEATIWYDPSNNTGLTISIYISTAQSNSKYDVWVTYKKK